MKDQFERTKTYRVNRNLYVLVNATSVDDAIDQAEKVDKDDWEDSDQWEVEEDDDE